jgi:5-methylcytosine-specific restriction endonuclease McrA
MTRKEYYQIHKEEIKKKRREFYYANKNNEGYKEKRKLWGRTYREKHKDQREAYNREYYQINKKSCKEKRNVWKANNKEHIREQGKEYRERTKVRIRKRMDEYNSRPEIKERRSEMSQLHYRLNHEKRNKQIKEYNKQYLQTLHGKSKNVLNSHRRRARVQGVGGNYNIQEWIGLKIQFNSACALCKKSEPQIKLTVDHIVPISLGGSNDISNIRPLCKSCNSKQYWKVRRELAKEYTVNRQ